MRMQDINNYLDIITKVNPIKQLGGEQLLGLVPDGPFQVLRQVAPELGLS